MRVERVGTDFAVKFAEHPHQPALSDVKVIIGALALLPDETARLGVLDPVEDPLITALDRQVIKREALYTQRNRPDTSKEDKDEPDGYHMTAEDLALTSKALQRYYETTPVALQTLGRDRVNVAIRREAARIANNMIQVIDDLHLEQPTFEMPVVEFSPPGFYL